jgi:hypothetical protein
MRMTYHLLEARRDLETGPRAMDPRADNSVRPDCPWCIDPVGENVKARAHT